MLVGLFIPPLWRECVLKHEKEVLENVGKMGMRLTSYRLHNKRYVVAIFKDYPTLTEGLGDIRRLQSILHELTGLYFDILILNRFK